MERKVINSDRVLKVFEECLIGSSKSSEGEPTIQVEGVQCIFTFSSPKLESYRKLITGWLSLLPHTFRRSGGGGWSFLQACCQEDGVQWTGFHQSMDQLFCLGMGLDLVKNQLPRNFWSSLPGGMPYYVIEM